MQILDNGNTVRIEYINYDLGITTFFDITKDIVKNIKEHIEFLPPDIRYYFKKNKQFKNWTIEIAHIEPAKNKDCVFFDICIRGMRNGVSTGIKYGYYIMKLNREELKEVVTFVNNKR